MSALARLTSTSNNGLKLPQPSRKGSGWVVSSALIPPTSCWEWHCSTRNAWNRPAGLSRAASDNRSKRAATQWIAYVDSEIKRRDLMAQDVPDYKPRERDDMEDVIDVKQ